MRFKSCCFLWLVFIRSCISFLLPYHTTRIHASAIASTNNNNSGIFNENSGESHLVVIDSDSLLNTIEHRSALGIKAALAAWPKLQKEQVLQQPDQSWLTTKLSALSHVLTDENCGSPSTTCEFALATRLILEEQALDEGESNGKRGKYASKYHPRNDGSKDTDTTTKTSSSSPSSSSSSSSTRPLTVGEISANWNTSLRETLLMRYHCDYKDPMPILQRFIDKHYRNDDDDTTEFPIPSVYRELEHSVSNRQLIVTVAKSDLSMVEKSLNNVNIKYHVAPSASQAVDYYCNEYDASSLILLPSQDSKMMTVQTLLKSYKNKDLLETTTVFVVDSSWKRLESLVELFGDSIPRQNNIGNCIFKGIKLSLNFPEWTAQQCPTNLAKATMNPWTDVLSWDTVAEFLSTQQEDAFQ